MTWSRPTRAGRVCTAAAVLLATVLAGEARADNGVDHASADHPLLPTVIATAPPALDGFLDDSLWTRAPRIDDFYCTDLDRSPTDSTVVWLACDASNFYFAVRCYDSDPRGIRMMQTRRSNSFTGDDYVAIELDVEHQHRSGGSYVFRVNPRGTQNEDFPDGTAGKIEWRGDWLAAARIDSLGWTAEIAIPLAMFNRAPGRHTIGVAAFRRHQRTNERIQWPNMGTRWDRERMGDWLDVPWPLVRRGPTIMPYVVGQVGRVNVDANEDGTFDSSYTRSEAYLGVDAKYTTPRGLVLVGTLYPDFRNVENEILGLEFSYSEQFRSDTRPFFAEGRRFYPDSWIFYSHRVGEIYGGAKVFGQLGKHRIGLIEAYDRVNVNHAAGQWYWQPIPRFEVENNVAWRHGPRDAPHKDGIPLATDHLIAITEIKKNRFVGTGTEYYRAQAGLTHMTSDTGTGYNAEVSYDRFGGNRGFDISFLFRVLSAGFMNSDGLLDLEESDQRDFSGRVGYDIERESRWFRQASVDVYARQADRLSGGLYRRVAGASTWLEIVRGVGVYGEVRDEDRPPHHDRTGRFTLHWNDDKLYVGGSAGIVAGRLKSTDYLLLTAGQGFHPFAPLSLRASAQYRRRNYPVGHDDKVEGGLEELYQAVGTAQFDITPERAISGRVTVTRDGANGYCTYRQVVRTGFDLFIILGDPSSATWNPRVALKAMVVL